MPDKEGEKSFKVVDKRKISETEEIKETNNAEEVKKIALMHIETINKTMSEHDKEIIVTDDALEKLVETGYSSKFGARFLKRTIDDLIKVPLTLKWKEGDIFTAELKDGEVSISSEKSSEDGDIAMLFSS